MHRIFSLVLVLCVVFLTPALAVDTFVYDGHFGTPGLRLSAPFMALSNGDCWTLDTPPYRGTPEGGIEGRLPDATSWPNAWLGAGGEGAWGSTYGGSYRHYNASGMQDGQVPDPFLTSGGTWQRAVAPSGSLCLVQATGGVRIPSAARCYDASGHETWAGELPASVLPGEAMSAQRICAFDGGFYCLFQSADLKRHAVVRYDLSGSAATAVVVDVTDAGQPFEATGIAPAPSGAANTFIVCGDATGAGLGPNAVFSLSPGGLTLLSESVGAGVAGQMGQDAYRSRVWVFGTDAFGYVDSSLAYHGAGVSSFGTPAEYLAWPYGVAAGGGKVLVGDGGNHSGTLWTAAGTGPVVYQVGGNGAIAPLALRADGTVAYLVVGTAIFTYTLSSETVAPLYNSGGVQLRTRPALGGGLVWVAGENAALGADVWVLAADSSTGTEQKRWGTDIAVSDLRDLAVSPDGTHVALGCDSGDAISGASVVVFDRDGHEQRRIKLPSFYELCSVTFADNSQMVALVHLRQDHDAPAELVGYDLTGASLWRTTLVSGLPENPYGGRWGSGTNCDYPCLAADETGSRLFVADARHGVVHRLVRQTQAAAITEVTPGASLRQRAVTVHVWGQGLPTSGTVVLRKSGASDIPLSDVTFDGQAHLWGIANLSSASAGWYDLVVNPGGAAVTYPNALLVATDYPPATLMGTWRLNAWGPPGSLATMYEDKLLIFLDEQGSYAWDRPGSGEGGSSAWVGKAAAYGDKLAMLNLAGLKRNRVAFTVYRDQLTLTQETGDGAPLVFQFTRRDEKTILGDEHVGAWKLTKYEGVLPASSSPTWNQTMVIYRDGSCRIESDRAATGPWWRSGALLLPGVASGPAVFRTKAASTETWAGQVWVGTWQWGATHQELVLSWLDESGRTWQETWQRTGDAPAVPVITVGLTGPSKITAGAQATYTVSCENVGTVSAKTLTLSLTVPWLNGGNPISLASLAELLPGEKRTLTYVVSCPASTPVGPYTFTAAAGWTLPEAAEERVSLDVTAVPPQLDIALSESGPLVARPMEPFTWTIDIANHGSDLSLVVPSTWDSQAAVYKDYDLASGVAITGWPTDGVHTGYNWVLTWGDLKRLIPHSGDRVAMRFTLMADVTARPHTWATNVVAVRPVDRSVPDVHPSDNVDGVSTEIRTAWDPNAIYVTPVAIPGLGANQTTPGGRLHYMVTFENEGTENANMVQVDVVLNPLLNLDTLSWASPEGLPAGATVEVTVDRSARRLRWVFQNLGLAPGAEGQVQFGVNVNSDVGFGGADSVALVQAAKIYFDFAVEARAQMTDPPATVTVVKPVGDVNGDGVVNLDDMRAFTAEWRRGTDPYMAHLEGTKLINADLNLNGRLDHEDAQLLIEKLLRQGDLR